MPKYVFKYRGMGASPKVAQAKLNDKRNLVVLRQSKNELIVSGSSADIKSLSRELDGWFFATVHNVPRPPVGSMKHGRVRRMR
jgi:hypothetical protein